MPDDNSQHGQEMESARFTFRGRIDCDSFTEFARHRAARLDIAIEFGACDPTSATISVTGHEALVDAFEMACSLGPYDCLVLDVDRRTLR